MEPLTPATNVALRTQDRVLLSISTTELDLIEQGLALLGSVEAQEFAGRLHAMVAARVPSPDELETVDAWTDGFSVQVRAITVYADPVDMGTSEARRYARRILEAADRVDQG